MDSLPASVLQQRRNYESCHSLLSWLGTRSSKNQHIHAFSFRRIPRIYEFQDCQHTLQLLSSYIHMGFKIPKKGIAHVDRSSLDNVKCDITVCMARKDVRLPVIAVQ